MDQKIKDFAKWLDDELTKEHDHSKLMSPSASGLWIPCPGMPKKKNDLQLPDVAGRAAERGTLQHAFAYAVPMQKITPEEVFANFVTKQETPHTLLIEEWCEVRTALKAVEDLLLQYPSTQFKDFYEVAVAMEDWRKDCFGTADRARLDLSNRTLFILDYKFGYSKVSVLSNSQLRIYALGMLALLRAKIPNIDNMIDSVVMGIVQPKVGDFAYCETITLEDLYQWDKDVLQPAQRAIVDGNGSLNPGEHCKDKYCKAIGNCESYAMKGYIEMDSFMEEFHSNGEDRSEKAKVLLSALDDPAVQDLLDKVPFLEAFFEDLKAEVETRIRSGKSLERYKIVNGRGKNDWTDDETAVKAMKSLKIKAADMYKKTLLTPAQARDVLKSTDKLDDAATEKLANSTKFVPGKEKLVAATDPGKPISFINTEEDIADLLNDMRVDNPTDQSFGSDIDDLISGL